MFAFVMVNSFKHDSSSFSDILGMCTVSAASCQIMADHGREAPGEREILSLCFLSTQIEEASH